MYVMQRKHIEARDIKIDTFFLDFWSERISSTLKDMISEETFRQRLQILRDCMLAEAKNQVRSEETNYFIHLILCIK